MYRVKAEAVSGSKVYAGGKWLQCIGNKRVSVGDRIWTDGRVVYGHNQEAQTPLIIAPQTQEAIPIATAKQNYIFDKNKLKAIDEPKFKNYIMINDKKSKVYFLYRAPNSLGHYEYYRDRALNYTEKDEYYQASNYYAANLKHNKLYSIGGDEDKIILKCDDTVFHEINLPEIMQDTLNITPPPPDMYTPPKANADYDHVALYNEHSFIEDDKNWSVIIVAECRRTITVAEVPGSTEPGWFEADLIGPPRDNIYIISFVFSCVNGSLPSKRFVKTTQRTYYSPPLTTFIENYLDIVSGNFIPNTPFYLQDGFYFRSMEYKHDYIWDYGEEYTGGQADSSVLFWKITMFTPNGNEIFTGLLRSVEFITFNKVKGGFFFGVYPYSALPIVVYPNYGDTTYNLIYSIGELNSLLVFNQGVFFLPANKNGNDLSSWKILSTEPCLNQRFRPMQRYKNWHKRIQIISD